MTSSTQSMLAQVLADPKLLAILRDDPARFAQRVDGDPEQARRLSRLDPNGVMVTAHIAWEKSRRRIQGAFPATSTVVNSDRRNPRLVRAINEARLDVAANSDDLAGRIAGLVDRLAAADEQAVIRDVIAFELLWYRLRTGLVQARHPSAGRPALRPGVAVATYGCRVMEAQRRIAAAQSYDDLELETTHHVLRMEGHHHVRVTLIAAPVADVLSRLDGETSIPDMSEAVGRSPREVEKLLRQASERGWVARIEDDPDTAALA